MASQTKSQCIIAHYLKGDSITALYYDKGKVLNPDQYAELMRVTPEMHGEMLEFSAAMARNADERLGTNRGITGPAGLRLDRRGQGLGGQV